jgi:hypothetical protein
MGIEVIIAIIMCALALGGVARGIFKWISRMDRNTEATERLTNSFDRFADRVETNLLDHTARIVRLETIADSQALADRPSRRV